ncbi:MAG: CAP domain-containing protein [Solirubrobacterales bacterium]|nr:CAP domain-containing protein [Solirubrobacterales bacterium]
MRSQTILAGCVSALAVFVLICVVMVPAAPARGLIAPKAKCANASGFHHKAVARKSMVCLTNYARRKKGLKRYKGNPRLNRSARAKATDIRRCNDFSHTACGHKFVFWFRKYGYTKKPGWSAGENIAWGSGRLGSSRAIFRAWLKSPGHRAAILSRGYVNLGVGLTHGKLLNAKGARIWVQHFGRRN